MLAISIPGKLRWADPWGSMARSLAELVNSKPIRDQVSKAHGEQMHEE